MINFKKFFSSVVLLLVAFQGNPIMADQSTALPAYQNTISTISFGYENSVLVGNLTLDNGLVMKIVDYKTRDDNLVKLWHSGDVVAFDGKVKNDALVLSITNLSEPNQDKIEAYAIFDVIKSPKSGLMISEINDDGKFVKLNDNSVWEFSWYNHLSTKGWKVGERVLVYGQGNKNSYAFINLDAPVSKNVATATASFIVH